MGAVVGPDLVGKIREERNFQNVMDDLNVKDRIIQTGLTPRFVDGKEYGKIVTKAVKSVPELIQYAKAAM